MGGRRGREGDLKMLGVGGGGGGGGSFKYREGSETIKEGAVLSCVMQQFSEKKSKTADRAKLWNGRGVHRLTIINSKRVKIDEKCGRMFQE